MRVQKRWRLVAAAGLSAASAAAVLAALPGSALAAGSGQYQVFSVSPSGNLYQDTWNGSWSGWQDQSNDGTGLTGSPGIAYDTTDGSYHAFAVSTSGHVYQDTITATGTSTWQDLGGTLQGGASAVYIAPSTSSCTPDNSCSPQTFADAILGYAGVNAPVTGPNEFAFETWERAEGGGAGCPGQPPSTAPWAYSAGPAGNPLNTTQSEPGSTAYNSVNVQIYADADGQTCWYWGVDAIATTLTNGLYQAIINVLDNPSASDSSQCVALAQAVGSTPWGTGDFQADC